LFISCRGSLGIVSRESLPGGKTGRSAAIGNP
jgi:hypothetical protein